MAICSFISVCFMFSLFFSVCNFYFTSQYHQFPLSHPAAAAAAFSSHTLSSSSSSRRRRC
jgi:membrane-anchored protein YejM (alkaline phosphatase superfamily)